MIGTRYKTHIKIHSKFLFVFGLIFFCAGMLAGYENFGKGLWAAYQTRSYQTVPAQIQKLELKTSAGESTTYTVLATYTFRDAGRTITSTDVSIYTGCDNVGSYWQDIYRDLQHAQSKDRAVAYVHPTDPLRSVLDRTYRWRLALIGSIFFGVFGGIGLAVIYLSTRARLGAGDLLAQARTGLPSNERNFGWFASFAGRVVIGIGSFIAILVLPAALAEGAYLALFILVIPLVGLLVRAIGSALSRKHALVGDTVLRLDPIPGAIGGQMGGEFEVDTWKFSSELDMRLTCYRSSGARSGRRRSPDIVWQDTVASYSKSSGDKRTVRFVFDVPDGLPDTGRGRYWVLKCAGAALIDGAEVKIRRSWRVPMAASTDQSRQTRYIPAQFQNAQAEMLQEEAQQTAEDQIDIQQIGQNLAIVSDGGHKIVAAAVLCFMGAVFAGIGAFFLGEVFFMGMIFIPVGLLLLISGIYTAGRKLSVVIDPDAGMVFSGRSWFGIPLGTKRLRLDNTLEFRKKQTGSITVGNTHTTYFAIFAHNGATKAKVAEGIAGSRAADAVIAKLSGLANR